jgi:hypothetical protein
MAMGLLRPRFHIATFLKFTAICCFFLALFHQSGVGLGFALEGPLSALYPLGIAVVCTLTLMRPKDAPPGVRSVANVAFPVGPPHQVVNARPVGSRNSHPRSVGGPR